MPLSSLTNRCDWAFSDKEYGMKKGTAVAVASNVKLPDDDEHENVAVLGCAAAHSKAEEQLEDWSESEQEDEAPSQQEPQPRLRRLVPGSRPGVGKAAPAPSSIATAPEPDLDSLMTRMNRLELRNKSPGCVGANCLASTITEVPSCTARPVASQALHGCDSEPCDSDGSGGDFRSSPEPEPFFQRLPLAAPSSIQRTAPSEDALVLQASNAEGGSSVPQAFVLDGAVAKRLYTHQVEGVKWLWRLHQLHRGGILGDDMGLGKTMQISAFLAGLLGSKLAKRILIVAPKTLLPHWQKELEGCGLRQLTRCFFGDSQADRNSALRSVTSSRGVLLTTYGMVQHNTEQLAGPGRGSSGFLSRNDTDDVPASGYSWDYMILDEGHKIKNPKMKLVAALSNIPVRMRIIISGTPIQNNLMEMHALFDFTTPGLLGDTKSFKKIYERPITTGQDKDATDRERKLGAGIASELRKRIEPYFLRREKKDVLGSGSSAPDGGSNSATAGGSASECTSASGNEAAPTSAAAASGKSGHSLPRKNDLVVWLRLKPLQEHIYKAFLLSDRVKAVFNEKASPLAAITVLKKICDHPALISERASQSVIAGGHKWAKGSTGASVGGGGSRKAQTTRYGYKRDDCIADDSEDDEQEVVEEDPGSSYGEDSDGSGGHRRSKAPCALVDDEAPIEWGNGDGNLDHQLMYELEQRGAGASCKTAFVLALLAHLHSTGHRTLIFSQSKVMLNILEAGVKAMDMTFCRIDGDVSSAEDRQAQVRRFQTRNDIPVFLLTSQVGGLGLTITAADRVIIVDPNWNPAIDAQSVDRAYRIGQKRDVVVYRLITCGTVEEKIYRKQIFKGGLSKTGTESGIQFRYFSQMELRDLFAVTAEGLQASSTQRQLHELHAAQRQATPELKQHLSFLEKLEGYAGISDHDLLFTQRPQDVAPTAEEGAAYVSQLSQEVAGPTSRSAADSLASQLSSSLRLGAHGQGVKPAAKSAESKVKDAQDKCARFEAALRTMSMPDGGKKLRQSLLEAQRELQQALAEVRAVGGAAPGAAASATAFSNHADSTRARLPAPPTEFAVQQPWAQPATTSRSAVPVPNTASTAPTIGAAVPAPAAALGPRAVQPTTSSGSTGRVGFGSAAARRAATSVAAASGDSPSAAAQAGSVGRGQAPPRQGMHGNTGAGPMRAKQATSPITIGSESEYLSAPSGDSQWTADSAGDATPEVSSRPKATLQRNLAEPKNIGACVHGAASGGSNVIDLTED